MAFYTEWRIAARGGIACHMLWQKRGRTKNTKGKEWWGNKASRHAV